MNRALEECHQVIVFGSRAVGVHAGSSDLDLFCVGGSEPRRPEKLDIVRRTLCEVESPKWLGSELANHIAAYGVALRGRCDWKNLVSVGEQSISHKEHRVVALVNGLWRYWDRLHPEFRRKHLITIRREVQRLELLTNGKAVPPTPILDRNWKRDPKVVDAWATFAERLKTSCLKDHERMLRTTGLITSSLSSR